MYRTYGSRVTQEQLPRSSYQGAVAEVPGNDVNKLIALIKDKIIIINGEKNDNKNKK